MYIYVRIQAKVAKALFSSTSRGYGGITSSSRRVVTFRETGRESSGRARGCGGLIRASIASCCCGRALVFFLSLERGVNGHACDACVDSFRMICRIAMGARRRRSEAVMVVRYGSRDFPRPAHMSSVRWIGEGSLPERGSRLIDRADDKL